MSSTPSFNWPKLKKYQENPKVLKNNNNVNFFFNKNASMSIK